MSETKKPTTPDPGQKSQGPKPEEVPTEKVPGQRSIPSSQPGTRSQGPDPADPPEPKVDRAL